MHPQYTIPNASGIYRIVCVPTRKIYLGSSIDLRVRGLAHFSSLRRNAHCNAKLQRAWNKYGPDAFVFEVVELVLPMSLTAREQYWFNKLKPFDKRGFNIAPIAGSPEPSKETRQKMRESQTGKKHSAKTIEKIRASALERPPRSHETYLKWSAGHIGKPAHNRGKKAPPELCEQLRLAHADERKTLIVTAPNGTEQIIHGIRQFCREHNLNRSALLQVAKGKCHHHKGWKARYPLA